MSPRLLSRAAPRTPSPPRLRGAASRWATPRRAARRASVVCVGALAAALGCAGAHESAVRADFRRAQEARARPVDASAPEDAGAPEDSRGRSGALGPELEAYVAHAAERSPALRASFERWRASVHGISPAKRLPDPMFEIGVYVWNSGENTSPALGRLGLRQELPWPGTLRAGADAASAEARARQRQFEAELVELRRRVADAYYRLWLLRRLRAIEQEHLTILQSLSESALGRVATGAASLADQQRIELTKARLADSLAAFDEQERAEEARLRAIVGAERGVAVRTSEGEPSVALPAEDPEVLLRAALQHPAIEVFVLEGEAAEARARRERIERWPGFVVGVEWMSMPGGMSESGIMPSLGVRLPLWQGAYAEAIRGAEAEAAARLADGQAALLDARAALEEALSRIRDSKRRIDLHRHTLLPQAEAAYGSVLGAYATGRASVAASLLAQKDLIELRIGLEQARVDHALAWAELERVVGRPVTRASGAPGGEHD